ncbi:type I restriction-modification system subunit M N-terminal domain-containing protein [Corynebacterium sp. CCUG 69979]|uniref:type I restriction-modification system subunit M N-terminal domain-containing protein n=1 Tax=Corynebacterium sp. CCUG 69979 TaxID=2823890 RepID=UPI00210EF73F|nr:type I restriction-modification system subunit M N-terminal domain-containing protein [Corynebacterium sp. CCUG 69979]
MEASQYKEILLGLVFLKYVTDAFDARATRSEASSRRKAPLKRKSLRSSRTAMPTWKRTCSGLRGKPVGSIKLRPWRRSPATRSASISRV